MFANRETVAGMIGGAIAVLLQLLVAPIITIGSIVPNFIVAFCVVRAVACPFQAGALLPFVLGLIFDLVGGGPVGIMAFTLLVVTFVASRAYLLLNNDTLFMPLVVIIASTLLAELIYGIMMLICGLDASFFNVFVYRVLPCFLFDAMIALILYPIASRVMTEKPMGQPGTPVLR